MYGCICCVCMCLACVYTLSACTWICVCVYAGYVHTCVRLYMWKSCCEWLSRRHSIWPRECHSHYGLWGCTALWGGLCVTCRRQSKDITREHRFLLSHWNTRALGFLYPSPSNWKERNTNKIKLSILCSIHLPKLFYAWFALMGFTFTVCHCLNAAQLIGQSKEHYLFGKWKPVPWSKLGLSHSRNLGKSISW